MSQVHLGSIDSFGGHTRSSPLCNHSSFKAAATTHVFTKSKNMEVVIFHNGEQLRCGLSGGKQLITTIDHEGSIGRSGSYYLETI